MSSALLPTDVSTRDALGTRPRSKKSPPKSKGMERDECWWALGMERSGLSRAGALRPITSRHGDLRPPATLLPNIVADLDVGTSGDGIKLLRSPCHLVSGTAAELRSVGGLMGMGASSQSRKHPRSLAVGLAFHKQAEKIIYWQIKIFRTKLLPCRNGWRFPMLPPGSLPK